MSITINRSYKYVDFNVSAPNNRGYLTIDTSSWIDKPWMFYELPALKFEIYTETDGELLKYKNFTREIRTYNPVYSPLGVLNVTIDIRNVPEEFILRIIPIFDNDAVAARNMLIKNGIENGDIWGSDQDVPTQLFNLDLEFIECEGEYVPPTPPVPPTHEETITGIPPITFDGSTGQPLISWTILGNDSQSGTPTPDNPVMPEFVGAMTANLFENGDVVVNVGDAYKAISVSLSAGKYAFSFSYESENTGGVTIIFYNGSATVQYSTATINDGKGTIAINAGQPITTIRLYSANGYSQSESYSAKFTDIMLNSGSTALPYEPFGYKIPITCAGQTVPVYLGQVSTVRWIRKLVLDGTENWHKSATYVGSFYAGVIRDYLSRTYTAICTHLVHVSTAQEYGEGKMVFSGSGTSTNCNLWFNQFDKNTTVEDFKSYLASEYAEGHPVTVWYVLAEPTTGIINEPLCKIGDYADELHSTDAGVVIPTTKGQNTLTVDTPIQPSEMTITYIKEGQ